MQPALTVRDLFACYLRHVRIDSSLCAEALGHRERTLADFARVHGDSDVADLRPYHLTDWIDSHTRWKSKSTRQLHCAEVRAVFGWAVDEERISRHPFKRVRYGRSERRPALPDEILERMLRNANACFANALRFLRLTGCRVGELCRARWADVDLASGLWIIPRHKGRKATRKPKVLPLTGEAVRLLKTIAEDATATRTMVARATSEVVIPQTVPAQTAIFVNSRGTPYSTSVLRQAFASLRQRLGIKGYCLHAIRHQAATAAVRAGAPIKYVSLMLGHRTCQITEEFYVSVDDDFDGIRAAAEAAGPKFK